MGEHIHGTAELVLHKGRKVGLHKGGAGGLLVDDLGGDSSFSFSFSLESSGTATESG